MNGYQVPGIHLKSHEEVFLEASTKGFPRYEDGKFDINLVPLKSDFGIHEKYGGKDFEPLKNHVRFPGRVFSNLSMCFFFLVFGNRWYLIMV